MLVYQRVSARMLLKPWDFSEFSLDPSSRLLIWTSIASSFTPLRSFRFFEDVASSANWGAVTIQQVRPRLWSSWVICIWLRAFLASPRPLKRSHFLMSTSQKIPQKNAGNWSLSQLTSLNIPKNHRQFRRAMDVCWENSENPSMISDLYLEDPQNRNWAIKNSAIPSWFCLVHGTPHAWGFPTKKWSIRRGLFHGSMGFNGEKSSSKYLYA